MLRIGQPTAASASVLELTGRLQFAAGEALLRERIGSLLALGCRCVTVNLERVTAVDAAGLGSLVWAKTMLERAGGTFVLANPGRCLRRLLELTRLDGQFDIVDQEYLTVPIEVTTCGSVRPGRDAVI